VAYLWWYECCSTFRWKMFDWYSAVFNIKCCCIAVCLVRTTSHAYVCLGLPMPTAQHLSVHVHHNFVKMELHARSWVKLLSALGQLCIIATVTHSSSNYKVFRTRFLTFYLQKTFFIAGDTEQNVLTIHHSSS